MKIFQIKLIFRVLLLFFALAALSFYTFGQVHPIRAIFSGVAVVISVGEMLHFVYRTNRSLSNFLTAIIHNDFALHFLSEEEDNSYKQLFGVFNEVSEKFGELVAAREKEHLYLENLIAHLQVGVLATEENGHVMWMNESMKKLLNRPHLHELQGLDRQYPDLTRQLLDMQNGQTALLSRDGLHEKQLLFRMSLFRLDGANYRLYSAQDIQSELAVKEGQAWENLLRVLTHEIMNSVTPISSLSKSLLDLLQKSQENAMPRLQSGLDAISNRSDALLGFTTAYRQLAAIPFPRKQPLLLEEVLGRIHTLFEPQLAAQQIAFSLSLSHPQLSLEADPELLDQVIINLLQNAMEALEAQENGKISIQAGQSATGKVEIGIHDNGPGIAPGLQEKVFIPFFTTKEKGSGIGLSLSRQIMLKHGGKLLMNSEEGKGTGFLLQFA